MPNLMQPSASALSLLSTAGIQDPQVRNFCDRLVEAWAQLNADGGVVKNKDFARMTGQALTDALSNGIFSRGGQIKSEAQINSAIDNLAESIRKSILYQVLETQLRPEDLIEQVRRLDDAISRARAGASREVVTRENKDSALASAINRVWAIIGGSTAVIDDGALAAATPTSAVATKWEQVIAAVTDPNTGVVSSASILEETRAYASENDGTLNALYSVRAQVSAGGQTVIGGFGLAATDGAGSDQGPTIDFGILATRFWIAAPAGSYDPQAEYVASNAFPFIVVSTPTVINGVAYAPGVYMKRAAIGHAAIGTAEIADLSVNTAKITDLSVNTAKIADLSVNTAKIADLSVDTLKIAGNAVTIPNSTSSSSSINLIASGEQTLSVLPTFVSKGGQVVIVFGGMVTSPPDDVVVGIWRVRRNGAEIFASTAVVPQSSMLLPPVTDVPGNGAYVVYTVTYQLISAGGTTTAAMTTRSTYSLETIR